MQFSNLPFTHTHTHFLLPPSSHRTSGRGQIGCLSKKSFYLKSFFSLVTFWGYVVVCRIVCVCVSGGREGGRVRDRHTAHGATTKLNCNNNQSQSLSAKFFLYLYCIWGVPVCVCVCLCVLTVGTSTGNKFISIVCACERDV